MVSGTLRRIASRASGGVPKKPLKNERCLGVGWARVRVQALIVPSRGTENGRLAWLVLTWKPVTLPTAWQGESGQEGSGTVEVLPRTTVAVPGAAALAAAKAPTATRAQRTAPNASRRPRRRPCPVGDACEDLDIQLLLSAMAACRRFLDSVKHGRLALGAARSAVFPCYGTNRGAPPGEPGRRR